MAPNENVHAFYYAWYGNPKYDKRYYHWNHEYLHHWNKGEAIKWPSGVLFLRAHLWQREASFRRASAARRHRLLVLPVNGRLFESRSRNRRPTHALDGASGYWRHRA